MNIRERGVHVCEANCKTERRALSPSKTAVGMLQTQFRRPAIILMGFALLRLTEFEPSIF